MNIQQFTNPQFWTSLFPNWWSIIINIIDIALVAWLLYFLIKAIVGTKIMILVRGVIIFFLAAIFSQFFGFNDYFLADQSSDYLWGYRAGCDFLP